MVKSSKSFHTQLIRHLRKWHRKLGIFAAFFLIFLSVTGIALNHTDTFKLSSYHVKIPWLQDFYGISEPNQLRFYQPLTVTDDLVWLHDKVLLEVTTPVISIGKFQQYFLIATQEQLFIYSKQGALVDKLSNVSGLPSDITHLSVAADRIIINSAKGYFQTDSDFFEWQLLSSINEPKWVKQTMATEAERAQAILNYKAQFLTWERIVVDTHSGRFFGIVGVLFMDAVAVFLILLSLSGIYIWIRYSRAKR